jgi:ParB family chromosome partitioning protein
MLADADGEALTVESHASCPGHAVYLTNAWGYFDPTTGEAVNEPEYEEGDLDDEDESGAAQGDEAGERGPVYGEYLSPVYVCTKPDLNGHQPRYPSYGGGTSRPKMADLDPEQQAVARAERRDVIESNKAWRSAETVRRAWIRTFLARKTAPKGTAALVSTALAVDSEPVTSMGGNQLAADLLGCEATPYGRNNGVADLISQASEARAQVIGLALVLAGYEATTHIGSWRRVNDGTRRYLEFLAACGYALSPVEQRACGHDAAADEQGSGE